MIQTSQRSGEQHRTSREQNRENRNPQQMQEETRLMAGQALTVLSSGTGLDQLPIRMVQALHETLGNSALAGVVQPREGRWSEREAVSLPRTVPDLPPAALGGMEPALTDAPDFSALPPLETGGAWAL